MQKSKILRPKKRVQIHPETTEIEIPARVSLQSLDEIQDLRQVEVVLDQDGLEQIDSVFNQDLFHIPNPPQTIPPPTDEMLDFTAIMTSFPHVTKTSTGFIIFHTETDMDLYKSLTPSFTCHSALSISTMNSLLSLGIGLYITYHPNTYHLLIPDKLLLPQSLKTPTKIRISLSNQRLSWFTKSILIQSLVYPIKGDVVIPRVGYRLDSVYDIKGPVYAVGYAFKIYLVMFYVVLIVLGLVNSFYVYFDGKLPIYEGIVGLGYVASLIIGRLC
jgi:hypothetical protein